MLKFSYVVVLLGLVVGGGCVMLPERGGQLSFQDTVAFLAKHHETVVLVDRSGKGQLAVVPALQGRVMTSTLGSQGGDAYGWLNRSLIASAEIQEHVNPYGGEDRLLIGPDGGQFSVCFRKGEPFDYDHWFLPPAVDNEPFEVISQAKHQVLMGRGMYFKNYSGSEFRVQVKREVRAIEFAEIARMLGLERLPAIQAVAFESRNTITNKGSAPWRKETGLLALGVGGRFVASSNTTVVVPFVKGEAKELGPVVNKNYSGKDPGGRLVVGDGVVFFRGDGSCRCKFGIPARRARSVMGSYDAARHVLTIVQYNKPGAGRDYVNSGWALQEKPYDGDAVTIYNNGPSAPDGTGKSRFYELATWSPAAKLGVGGTLTHIHRTIHLSGAEADLDPIARKLLGVSIADIRLAL